MNILDTNSTTLRAIVSLCEKRDDLLIQVAKVEASLRAFDDFSQKSDPIPDRSRQRPYREASGGRRGKVKDLIIAELQAAGKGGVSVKELAPQLGLKAQNLHVWFNTTGKKLGAKRIGPGKYRL